MENGIKVERSTFIVNLLEEVDRVDPEMFPISDEVEKDSTVLGEMSTFCKRLYALAQFYSREMERLEVETKYTSNPEEQAKIEALIRQHSTKALVATDILFASIRVDFNVFGHGHLGIRTGWKVIQRDCDHKSDGAEMLKRLLGLE